MQDVIAAITRSFGNLFEPRIIAIMFVPMLGSLVAWTLLAWLFWDAWTGGIAGAMANTTVAGWLQGWSATWVIDYTAMLVVIIAILPAMFVTALVITEIIAMPVIVGFIAERHHPDLARAAGGTIVGGVLNAATGIGVFALLWIFTLPLWLTGVGAVLAPVLTSAWLNQRLFRYDALAEHASREEFARRPVPARYPALAAALRAAGEPAGAGAGRARVHAFLPCAPGGTAEQNSSMKATT